MAETIDLLDLGDEEFVSLVTFRRNGDAVATTVWVVRDGEGLLVTTHGGTGKVKRLRNDPRVELRASGRLGKVDPDAPVASGVAVVLRDPESTERLDKLLRAKYGMQYRAMMGVETVVTRGKPDRVAVRITPQ